MREAPELREQGDRPSPVTGNAANDAPCRCDCAYIGAQMAGTPTRCERCRGLVDAVATLRMELVYAEARRRLEADGTPDPEHRCGIDGCDGSRIGHDFAATFTTRAFPAAERTNDA